MEGSSYGTTFEIDLKTGGFKEYSQDLNTVNTGTGAVVASTSRMNRGIKGMTSSLLLAVAVMSVASRSIQGMTQYISESVDSYRDFQEASVEVSTILGNMDMNLLPSLTAGVEGLSKSFGKSATDLSDGLYNILSAAVPAEDALELLYTSTKAAVAGLSDVSTSVDVMTSVLNAYGMTVEQMVHVSDVMFQSIIRGKFRFSDLASALGYVTPIAAQAGISFEELSAALATATRHGLHIDMTARGLALAMQNIIKPGESATKVAAEYGIELSLASLRAQGLIGFIENLNEATNGNAAVISQIIPNMRSYRVMMVLAGEGVAGVTKDVTLMSESLGKADGAFTKMAQTASRQTEIIVQTAEDMRRQVGESFLELDLLMKKLDIFKGFFISEMFDTTTTPLGGFLKTLGPIGGLFDNLIQAAGHTNEVWQSIDAQIAKYSEKWTEDFASILDPMVSTESDTLFNRLLGGENVDLSSYENKAKEYLDAAKVWVDATLELEKAHSSGAMDDSTYAKMRFEIEAQYDEVMQLYDAYAYYKSGVDDAEAAIESHSDSLDIYIQKMSELKKEIGDINNLYDGTLGKQLQIAEQDKKVADMSHYVSLAIEDEKYQTELASQGFNWYTSEVDNAISVIRAYEAQQKNATEATEEFNFALAKNRIAMMQLQLVGMMRRRGMTRSEQQHYKALQIERTQMQIDAAQAEYEAELNKNELILDNKETTYQKAKSIIESMERDEDHLLWKLKNNRADDIESLKAQISTKEQAYIDLSGTVIQTHKDMEDAINIYSALIQSYYGDQIPAEIQNSIDAFRELEATQKQVSSDEIGANKIKLSENISTMQEKVGTMLQGTPFASIATNALGNVGRNLGLPGFERGTWSVPQDMIAQVHKGEVIRPNGSASAATNVHVEINVTGNTLTGEADEERLAHKIGALYDKKLLSKKTGKSYSRVR